MSGAPITKRWPGHHCTRAKVWIPNGSGYSSVEVETRLVKPVADLIIQLLTKGLRLDSLALSEVNTLAEKLRNY